MENYDVFIAGGGMSGSAVAKFAARGGLKTLFVERCKTPRTQPCSGIQFKYFEKILDEKIPPERLCNKPITRTKMYYHDGTSFSAPFKVFNYMRKTFDNWLNLLAQESGAEFRDECEFIDFEEGPDDVIITIQSKGKEPEQIKARYAIDATGLSSLPLRKKLRPQDLYETLAKTITTQTKKNQEREIDQFETNEELKKYLKKSMFTTGIKMLYHSFLNKFRPVEKLRLLPP